MRNSTLVSPGKMEYGWNFSISGLKFLMKSGLGKIFLKFLHALTMSFLLLNFDQKYKFSNKNKISPIFHFARGHQSWICHIQPVKYISIAFYLFQIPKYRKNNDGGFGLIEIPDHFTRKCNSSKVCRVVLFKRNELEMWRSWGYPNIWQDNELLFKNNLLTTLFQKVVWV